MMDVYDYGYAVMQVTMIVNDWEFEFHLFHYSPFAFNRWERVLRQTIVKGC